MGSRSRWTPRDRSRSDRGAGRRRRDRPPSGPRPRRAGRAADLVSAAVRTFGHLDILVCNHARSGGDGPLGTLDAGMLDAHWSVNTRSVILLTQAFADQHDGRPGGRVIFMTSGQDLGPMRGEVAYAAAKGALASITRTLADHLADQAVTLNTVNPGPVDTGYAPPEVHEAVSRRFPGQRWATPDDPARLIAWLVTDEAAWITGQVVNSEGGSADGTDDLEERLRRGPGVRSSVTTRPGAASTRPGTLRSRRPLAP
ncbi:SDR family oxidoreductase [Streptosporangium lutulentum]